MRYDPSIWYWIVGGDDSQVWSSQRAKFVQANDPDYSGFLATGGRAAAIASLDELEELFVATYPGGMLQTYAADVRWRKEVGGITVGDVQVATDDRSKLLIAGARIKADSDPEFTTKWKTPSGRVQLDAATIIAMSDAVLAHVDSCFEIEDAVLTSISNQTITNRDQIDAAFA